MGRTGTFFSTLVRMLRPRGRTSGTTSTPPAERGRSGTNATAVVAPPPARALRLDYAPSRDGAPDAGEIVWTWVPYAEGDGRGKDRPVLVIARQDRDRVYAVRLTSKPHEREDDYVALGAGEWDPAGRASWVDVSRLYSVHARGMRREASALDPKRFQAVAAALHRRYGWRGAR